MNNKIITFSFDDGTQFDKRLIDLFNKYHMKCTFNINAGLYNFSFVHNQTNNIVNCRHMDIKEMENIYRGHEIAMHTYTHPHIASCSKEEIYKEVHDDIEKLKQDFHLDNIVSGAYPFGEYNEDVVDVLKQLGIKICRTTNNTYRYDVDGDLLIYNPTIYYRDPLLKQQLEQFLNLKTNKKQVFCIWGHSYEFEVYNEWDYFESILKMIANKDDIDYLTNGEAFANDDSGVVK